MMRRKRGGPPSIDLTILLSRIAVVCILASVVGSVQAAKDVTPRFWNLTGETITHFSMAPTGTTAWGPDQCHNDPDGSVDFDERLRITGVPSGHYDVRFTDKTGRSCLVTDIAVKAGAVFSIGKELLTHCDGP